MSGPEVLPVRAVRMMLPLGQPGSACYVHTPRRPVVEVAEQARPAVLEVERGALERDGAPGSVAVLARRMGGRVSYCSGLYPDGPSQSKGESLPALDRWVLIEWITVRWEHGRRRGFALWRRSGRGNWKPGKAWWRGDDGRWTYGRVSAVPSDDGSGSR